MSRTKSNWPVYHPQAFEARWQEIWEQQGLYRALETSEPQFHSDRPKFYCLDFFPYPSGEGLHVGHCRNYVPTDVLSRYKRMSGFNVLHPMGWDAFGEPAEQYAVAHGVHPRVTTDRNSANFRRQYRLFGTSYDWSREIDSSDPDYYRWTQWFFLLLYRRGLAYRDTNWQWWCPTCQTTLSSHEVVGGVCWRGHAGVTRREIPAWYFKITAYADELISGLDNIDWPEPVKALQRNWIGRSEGMEINFPVAACLGLATDLNIRVFTTRPDTLAGATFLVLAPEHPLVDEMTTPEQRRQVDAYRQAAARPSEIERQEESRPKTGVFTGAYAVNPLNQERLPIWIADYVLPTYGFGAIMAVPAHDQRDYDFARQYNLTVRVVIQPVQPDGPGADQAANRAYTGDGCLVNSGQFNGLPNLEAGRQIGDWLAARGAGAAQVNYRMRDWLISRQRYWGTPIPIIHCPLCGMAPVPEEQLPVRRPEMENFTPDGSGRSPLARNPEFLHTACPQCGGPAQRETDTMGGFACSSWYFLRFASPHETSRPFDPEAIRYWLPVDLYVGGTEHAVLHLLYSRFWIKVMADAGILPFREPFTKLLNQGQLLGPDGQRMSKSRGNVITPDSVVARYGADALRIYEMFMAPFDQDIAWSMNGISGAQRFLVRLWKLYGDTFAPSQSASAADAELERRLHSTIQRVSERIESFRFNTMISTLMEFVNVLSERQRTNRWWTKTYHDCLEQLLVIMAPAAPYITEELWRLTGHPGSVHSQNWPVWNVDLARDEKVSVAIQVNGRVRLVLECAPEVSQAEVQAAALAHPKVQQYLQKLTVAQVYYVPGKVMNIVTQGDS